MAATDRPPLPAAALAAVSCPTCGEVMRQPTLLPNGHSHEASALDAGRKLRPRGAADGQRRANYSLRAWIQAYAPPAAGRASPSPARPERVRRASAALRRAGEAVDRLADTVGVALAVAVGVAATSLAMAHAVTGGAAEPSLVAAAGRTGAAVSLVLGLGVGLLALAGAGPPAARRVAGDCLVVTLPGVALALWGLVVGYRCGPEDRVTCLQDRPLAATWLGWQHPRPGLA